MSLPVASLVMWSWQPSLKVHFNDDANYPPELTQEYTMTKKLGDGTFGEVRLAYKQGTLERVAVKILKKKGSQLLLNNVKQIENDIKLLRSVNHQNIIRQRVYPREANRLWFVKTGFRCFSDDNFLWYSNLYCPRAP